MTALHVRLAEWQSLSPDDPSGAALAGVRLDPPSRGLANDLARQNVVKVVEVHNGLVINTFSYVGRVQLGPLTLTIEPKLGRDELLELFRYAYGLRNLRLLEQTEFAVGGELFQDILGRCQGRCRVFHHAAARA